MKTLNREKLFELTQKHTKIFISQSLLSGAEIIVSQDNQIILHCTFGTDGVDGPSLPCGKLYRIASMTKPITAAALLQQVDCGKVDLLSPVSDYLPAFVHMTVGRIDDGKIVEDHIANTPVRVFHLLCHTSGIGAASFFEHQKLPWDSVQATAEYFSSQPLAFDPFTSECYSPTAAFDVAARIVEICSGEPYGTYLQRHIFQPLGMRNTTFTPTEDQKAQICIMHTHNEEGKSADKEMDPHFVFPGVEPKACCAGGGLLSSAIDYSLFAGMLLRKGKAMTGEVVLSERSVKALRTPQVPETIQPGYWRWGLGVRVITDSHYPYRLPIGAFGWSGAFGTHFWVDPTNNITAVYMKNTDHPGLNGEPTVSQFEMDVMDSFD